MTSIETVKIPNIFPYGPSGGKKYFIGYCENYSSASNPIVHRRYQ
jgi:hypothetical protein